MAASTDPVGLQRLSSVDCVYVKQKTTVFANKYVITDEAGSIILNAKEDSPALHVFFGGNNRRFQMELIDTNNQTVINLRRPHCMGSSKMEVKVSGTLASIVREESTFLKPVISVNDHYDKPIFRVKGSVKYKCDGEFKVLTRSDQSHIGMIKRKWGGLVKEVFTDTDTFTVRFPRDLHVRYKAALIGTCLLIDFLYFESS